jgi:hypothetical protein
MGMTEHLQAKLQARRRNVATRRSKKLPPYVCRQSIQLPENYDAPGLHAVVHSIMDPKFWDHYLHGSVTSNETNKPEVHLGEDATLDERLKFLIMSKSGKRCSERNKKERRENGSAARMRRTMKGYAAQHAIMQDDLLRILKASDHARPDDFRKRTMLFDPYREFFESTVRNEQDAKDALIALNNAMRALATAQEKINRSTSRWYHALEHSQPATFAEHVLRNLLLRLCERGVNIDQDLFKEILSSLCASDEYQLDASFQSLANFVREHVVHMDAMEYAQWLLSQRLSIPHDLQDMLVSKTTNQHAEEYREESESSSNSKTMKKSETIPMSRRYRVRKKVPTSKRKIQKPLWTQFWSTIDFIAVARLHNVWA